MNDQIETVLRFVAGNTPVSQSSQVPTTADLFSLGNMLGAICALVFLLAGCYLSVSYFKAKKQLETGQVSQDQYSHNNKRLLIVGIISVLSVVLLGSSMQFTNFKAGAEDGTASNASKVEATEIIGVVDTNSGKIDYNTGKIINRTQSDYKITADSLIKFDGVDDGGCIWKVQCAGTLLFQGKSDAAGSTGASVTVPADSSVDFSIISNDINPQKALKLTGKNVLSIKINNEIVEPVKPECTVTFDMCGYTGGQVPKQTTVKSGEKIIAPTQPSQETFTFYGWYTDKECTTLWDFDNDIVTKDTTLYGRLEKEVLAITLIGSSFVPFKLRIFPNMTWEQLNIYECYKNNKFKAYDEGTPEIWISYQFIKATQTVTQVPGAGGWAPITPTECAVADYVDSQGVVPEGISNLSKVCPASFDGSSFSVFSSNTKIEDCIYQTYEAVIFYPCKTE